MATFDLLGILGVGRQAAALELAHAEERAALGALEKAVWEAEFRVDRARVRVAAARAREEAADALLKDSASDFARIDILTRRGRVPASEAQWAWAVVHMVEHAMSAARTARAEEEAELAVAAGIPPSHPAIAEVAPETIEQFLPGMQLPAEPAGEELLARVPELRALHLDYAVAEAELRREAAEQWPMIGLGPKVALGADNTLAGGILSVELPFPGSVDGRIAAAVQKRSATREAVEDALLGSLAAIRAHRRVLREGREVLESHARIADIASANMWRAARARFRADPMTLEGWSFALEHRIEPMIGMIEAREALALAALDLREALGPTTATTESRPLSPESRP
jgi:outer membrane protein TolC